MMRLQRSVVVVVVAIVTSHVISPAALSLSHGGAECGQNPMRAVHLVSQRTGKCRSAEKLLGEELLKVAFINV